MYFLGIDVSTTAVKALIIDRDGGVVASASTPTALSTPKPLWSEQDPADWWRGTKSSVRQALHNADISGSQVAAVGLTGQMHSLTLLDKAGKVLRPAILWSDQRTGAQCDEIRRIVGKESLIAITGNDALTGYSAPKILWVREHEPWVFAEVQHILLPKDFVRLQLTGDYATDKAGAAGTLLLDVKKRDWSAEILRDLQIPLQWLPETHEGPEITGTISPQASEATGLRAGTPVVGGGGDQAAQAVGVGAVEPGIFALTLGTGGNVFATTEEPFIEPEGRLHSFCHAVPGLWHLMGVTLSAGGSLRWLRDVLGSEDDFSTLVARAKAVPPGSEGLLFQPYLTGERTPHGDPLTRGSFIGLTLRHDQEHLIRAVLEGVAFAIRDSFELIKSCGMTTIRQVHISGGGAKSPLWRQILANVLDTELQTVNIVEGAAFGAALLAGVASGNWSDVNEASQATVVQSGVTSPQPEAVAAYQNSYDVYNQIYPALKDITHQLSYLSMT